MSHSKRNTSRAVFTSHERDLARRAWGATSARLSRESFLPFASCALCLEMARDPVACATRGDLFCRECALSNILAQKREAKRLERARELEMREARDARARADEEARERAVREFEMVQNGLDVKGRARAGNPDDDDDRTPRNNGNGDDNANDNDKRPGKRKLPLDADELARAAAEEDRRKARRLLDAERAEAAAKAALPSFWTPSMTPSTAPNSNTDEKKNRKTTKNTPTCPASREDDPHPYSLHTLVTVNFTEEEEEEGDGGGGRRTRRRVCPACRKGLSNASKAVLAKPCGHVLCRGCVDKFMRPGGTGAHHHNHHADPHAPEDGLRCYVCEADLTDKPSSKENGGDANNINGDNDDRPEGDGGKKKKKEKDKERERIRPGLIELRSEGTGFSAAGANEVKKVGVAFQC
ncbi:hypothetical protein DL768_010136 [Monosporascus sp. mg162]|nr:hypothetical protein DL768_010136 [Monosporascus sp. mg162]